MALKDKEVLIVDDDPDFRKFLERVLTNAGMRTTTASSVNEAIELAAKHAPHLILTDLNMPEESGFVLLELRRVSPDLNAIPTVVVSAQMDRASIYRAMALGALDYITKPIAVPVLLKKVRKALHDKEFLKAEFSAESRPRVTAFVKATIKSLSETGFVLDAPAKIAPQTRFTLRASLLAAGGIESCIAITHKSSTYLISEGHYGIYSNAAGLDADNIAKIREIMADWEA